MPTANLSDVLLANHFSENDVLDLTDERIPIRFFRDISWNAIVGENEEWRVTSNGDAGTFLRAPPSRNDRTPWIADMRSLVEGTRTLASTVWNNRTSLYASAGERVT